MDPIRTAPADAGADASDLHQDEDSRELTDEDRREVEAFQNRRAWHQHNHGLPELKRAGSISSSVLAGVKPLPNQLAQRLRHADLALRNAKLDLARNPESKLFAENVEMMRRQLQRAQEAVERFKTGSI